MTSPPKRLWVGLLLLAFCFGCPATTNFRDIIHEQTSGTARTLPPGILEVGAGFLVHDTLASLPVRYGLPHDIELKTNAGQLLLGVPNFYAENTFYSTEGMDFSVGLGFFWIHPPLLTLVPDVVAESFGTIHIVSFPIEVIGTFVVADWMDVNLGATYTHTELSGSFGDGESQGEGGIGTRELVFHPETVFYIADYTALSVGFQAPVFAKVPAHGGGQTQVADGVIIGYSAKGTEDLDVSGLYTTILALEFHYNETSRLILSGTYGMRIFTQRVEALLPGLQYIARF